MKRELIITPIDRETRAAIPTDEAAHHLSRSQQTLRLWASTGKGPLKPVGPRIGGRLMWPVSEIRRLVGVEAEIDAA